MSRWLAALRSALYATVFFALWGWLALAARALDPSLGGGLPSWTRAAGIPILMLGAALALWCLASFAFYGRGTPAPFDAPRELVAAGPYRWVRNPMYLAGLALLVGFGLIQQSTGILLLAAVFFLVFHTFVIMYEEPSLRRSFGQSYAEYQSSVRRWVPRRPTTRSP